MAETKPGVTSIPAAGPAGKLKGKKGKRNLIIIGGAAIAGIFLLSKKGSSSAAGTPQDQLGAYQQGVTDASNLLGESTGSSGIVGDGSGSGSGSGSGDGTTTTPPPGGNTGPTGPIIVVNPPPAPGSTSPGGKPKPPKRPPVGSKAGPHGAIVAPYGPKKPPPKKGFTTVGTGKGGWIYKPVAKPKTPPRGKSNKSTKYGTNKTTPKKTAAGNKKKSPALVESVHGAGSGVVVMGRTFPGALSHRMGGPQVAPDGTVGRMVVLDYGGHSDTHLVHGRGEKWTDFVAGANPPSRGMPQVRGKVSI